MENTKTEYKRSDLFLDNSFSSKSKWAREIVGFANRDGGKIIIGIEDDGTYEGNGIFKKFENNSKSGIDILKQKIENFCKDSISPHIVCNIFHEIHDKGEILIIDIPKREKYPHALIKKKYRVYYIRTSHGVIPIKDDSLIAWLYENSANIQNFRFISNIYKGKGKISFISDINKMGVFKLPGLEGYVPFIQGLYGLDVKEENISKLYSLLFPYALLASVARLNGLSWKTKKHKSRNTTTISYEKVTSEKVKIVEHLKRNLDKFKIGESSQQITDILSELKSSFALEFCVPKETTILIEHDDVSRSRIIFDNPQFEIQINCTNSGWRAGLGGTVYYSSIIDVYGYDQQENFMNNYSTLEFTIDINKELDYPEEGMYSFSEVNRFCNSIIETIKEKWDMNYLYSNISLVDKIYSIDFKTKLILQKLGLDNDLK